MDSFSLQSSHINGFCRSNLNFGSNPLVIRANKLLGFDYYLKQRSIRWPNFSLKCRTFVEGIEGGVSSSTDGSKPVELHHEGNEELKGQLVGPVKPSSASIVRFHLFSQPGLSFYPFVFVNFDWLLMGFTCKLLALTFS